MIHFDSSESDSFSGLISIPPSKEEKTQRTSNNGYSREFQAREFQAMLDSLEEEEEDDVEFSDKAGLCRREKKKRLGLNQVKALEKNFEVENKLDPERKLKLAQELNLKPRQVAVWFQNRRARWKTKQIERDYVSLKNNFEALQVDYSNLEKENRSLTLQLKELKTKMREENSEEGSTSVKEEEPVVSESENNVSIQRQDNNELCNENPLNDQMAPTSNSLMNWFQFQDSRSCWSSGFYQSHVVKREEQSLFNHTEESYNFFSVDQAPTLCWYFPEQ